MDLLTFVAEIVRSVAWPIATVLIAILFRAEIRGLARRLTRVRHNETELEFSEEVHRLKAEAERDQLLEPQPTPLTVTADNQTARLSEIAAISPRAAIMEAWLDVERAAADAVQRLNISVDRNLRSPLRFVSMLSAQHIDPKRLRQIKELYKLRSAVAHVPEFTIDDAAVTDYVQMARSMSMYLDGLG